MSELEQTPEARESRRRRNRVLWVLAAVLVVIALVVTPPLLNMNRLRRRITVSMSRSLGRPVHLDNVTLNILPVPSFTLENLVVSEDPSFGSEPVIRANSVRATLRFSSLWRRQVEFATIRFDDSTSVNLVRRSDGRWNFESILLHAAQEDAAPTAQTKPGPAPRFPYIEATGARLNVKMGDEKLPFALTDADFALWLPSPQEWRVRLEAKPARTDTSVSDTGLLTLEATLQKAARLEDVPIELTAAWRRAPLGEATRILTGSDAGWRGNVEATAIVHGTLGDAVATGNLKLINVRRSDFIPANTLNLEMDCSGHLAVSTAIMMEPSCRLPAGKAKSDDDSHGLLVATADTLALTGLHTTGLRLGMTDVPDAWLLGWARLFSQRIPDTFSPRGRVAGSVVRTVGHADTPSVWQGEFHDTVEFATPKTAAMKPHADSRVFSLAVNANGLTLAPTNIAPAEKSPLLLSGSVAQKQYSLELAGTASPQEIASLTASLPPLADGLEAAVPALTDTAALPIKLDLVCTRPWGDEQVCANLHAPDAVKKPASRHRH